MKRDDGIGNPAMMDQPALTCEQVDERDLDRRYLSGALSEGEAEAFEEHFFGCDRCWQLVKGGAAVRGGLAGGRAAPSARRAWRTPLALAAGLGVILLATWQALAPRERPRADVLRGGADSMVVQSAVVAGAWRADWAPVPSATAYRVRLFRADGELVLTRDLTDTTLRLGADSLAGLGGGEALFLEVQAFDALRRPLARSPLAPLR